MPLEERVYRFRCVEAWSMVVPRTGFPLKALLDRVEPLGSARVSAQAAGAELELRLRIGEAALP